jgi:hypothetical protein
VSDEPGGEFDALERFIDDASRGGSVSTLFGGVLGAATHEQRFEAEGTLRATEANPVTCR